VVCDPAVPIVAEAELSAAPPGRTARLIFDVGCATAEAAAVTRDLARGVLTQVEAMLADPATDLPAHLRAALAALAGALREQTGDRATVTALNTPLARAWRVHSAGGGGGEAVRMSVHGGPWIVGAARIAPRCWSGEVVAMPVGSAACSQRRRLDPRPGPVPGSDNLAGSARLVLARRWR